MHPLFKNALEIFLYWSRQYEKPPLNKKLFSKIIHYGKETRLTLISINEIIRVLEEKDTITVQNYSYKESFSFQKLRIQETHRIEGIRIRKR